MYPIIVERAELQGIFSQTCNLKVQTWRRFGIALGLVASVMPRHEEIDVAGKTTEFCCGNYVIIQYAKLSSLCELGLVIVAGKRCSARMAASCRDIVDMGLCWYDVHPSSEDE